MHILKKCITLLEMLATLIFKWNLFPNYETYYDLSQLKKVNVRESVASTTRNFGCMRLIF